MWKWAITMTTSESRTAPTLDLAAFAESQAALAAGLPDPVALAKLATEFFRELPADTGKTLGPIPARAPTALPVSTPVALPESAGSAGWLSPQLSPAALPDIAGPAESVASGVPHPGLLGGISPVDFSTTPSFSFIEEARSLFGDRTTPLATAGAGPSIKIPTGMELGTLPDRLNGLPPRVPATRSDVAAPAISGAAVHGDASPLPAFGFLEGLRPWGANTARSSESLPSEPSLDSVSNLSSIPFDVNAIRRDFPILHERVNGRPLVWLDNAATTHKPHAVIDRISYFYAHENSNIHRAAHTLAARATDAYEGAREKVRRFLNASSARDIIFVRGATEGINLIAQSWGRRNIQKDDEIVITWLEHHANIVPWQMLCAEKGARLRVAPVDDSGQVILEEYERLLGPRTRLVSFAQVSNALGTVTPVQEMVAMAHRHGARVLVDGAQAVSHMRVDIQAYDCDFYVLSGHKIFAPTGIGVVYGKSDVLDNTPPWQGGGNMISDVTFEKTVYNPPPSRFEAGTGSIADAVGLGAALDYLDRIGMHNIARYEHDLLVYATDALRRIPGLRLIGTAREKASVLSFVLDGFRTEDVGHALSQEGIAVRSGHHCAQPILRRFGVESTVRPSLAFYNTCEDIDALVAALWNLKSGRKSTVV